MKPTEQYDTLEKGKQQLLSMSEGLKSGALVPNPPVVGGASGISTPAPSSNVFSVEKIADTDPLKYPPPVPAPKPAVVPDITLPTAVTDEVRAAEGEQSSLKRSLEAALTKITGKSARKNELENEQNLPVLNKQLTELTNQIRQVNTEATQNTIALAGQGRGISQGVLDNQAQSIERQRTIKALGLSAAAQAIQGNIALANDYVERALDAEFGPVEAEIENAKLFLDLNRDRLTRADSKRTEAMQIALDERAQQVAEEKTNRATIYNVLLEASKNGADNVTLNSIRAAKTPEEALQAAGQYLQTPQTDVVKLDNGNTVVIDKRTGQVIKSLGGAAPSSDGIPSAGAGNVIAQAASNLTFGSKFQQEAFNANIERFVSAGDLTGAAELVFSKAIDTISDSDERKKTYNRYEMVKRLEHVQGLLSEYQAKGGDTGFFKGSVQDMKQRFGKVGDKDLALIGTTIANTLDELSRFRTGAALTTSEETFYKRLLPGTFKSAELNEATINGLSSSLGMDVENALRYQLTSGGYDAIKGQLGGLGIKAQPTAPSLAPAVDESKQQIFKDVTEGKGYWDTFKSFIGI